ncbi:MAG: DUF131 domain-containing protein [Candidatus Methanoperedens sp.]
MTDFIKIGFYLILAGFALVFTGSILSARNANFAGLVMIGPIPIAFGSSPGITLIAMVVGLFLMLAYFMLGRRNA